MLNGMDENVRGQCASRGQYWLRKVQRELYKFRPAMYAGDEDNGEMASWYVLSTLGLFSLSPGSPEYIFGSPLFEEVHVTVNAVENTILTIRALDNKPDNYYIQSVTWNGIDMSMKNGIDFKLLMEGGTLEFQMGDKPYSSNI